MLQQEEPMWLLALATTAQADDFKGYAEVRADYSHGLDGTPWGLHERLRPTLEVTPTDWLRVVGTVQAVLDQGRHAEQEAVDLLEAQLPAVLLATCPLPAAGERVQEISDVLSVERLYVDVFTERLDLRVGRQALNWGSALVLSPTDLFAETLISQPWQERQGVNAVRANVPMGERHQAVAVAAIGDADGDVQDMEARAGAKMIFNAASTDFALVASTTSDGEVFLGVDVKGQLLVGWWLEGGVHLGPVFAGDTPQAVVSAGVDYSVVLLDGLVVAAQYTYDGTGLADPEDYSLAARGGGLPLPDCDLADAAVQDSGEARFTIGRHYGLATARLSLLDDFQIAATALMNLQDRSTLVVPAATWKPGGAWSLDLSAQVFLGEGELNPHDTPVLTSLTLQSDPDQDATRIYLDLQGLVPAWSAAAYVRYAF